MKLEAGTTLHGRYKIVSEIAQGGLSVVYEAHDLLLDSEVAVKQLLFINDETRVAFTQEARILAGLSHHGIPKVIDLFEEDGEDYLVMELIVGPNLEMVARANQGPLDFSDVAVWADQILEALIYLHSSRPPIIHRDIKPSNLKMTPHGRVMLIDFGLAKLFERSHSRPGYTESYAPLEQLQRQGTDQTSDIYSLGATLYRLLSGRVPESALIRLEARISGAPDPLPPIDTINSSVPASFVRTLTQALALEREARLSTASAMRAALHETVVAMAADSVNSSGSMAPVNPETAEKPAPTRVEAAQMTMTHRLTTTTQLPRPELADVLSLGVLPETGDGSVRLAERLQALVESAPSFQEASERRRVRGSPTADGLVLAFFDEPLLVLRTALDVARAWRLDSSLSDYGVRMGLSRGLVMREVGISADIRMSQAGIFRSREIMRLAQAGQLLLPAEMVERLTQLNASGSPVDMGDCLVGDHTRVHLYAHNLYPQSDVPTTAPMPIKDVSSVPPVLPPPPSLSAPLPPPPIITDPVTNKWLDNLTPRAENALPYLDTASIKPLVEPAVGPADGPAADPFPASFAESFTPAVAGVAPELETVEEEAGEPKRRLGFIWFLLFLFLLVVAAIGAVIWKPTWLFGKQPSISGAENAQSGSRMNFVKIGGGRFVMGANNHESDEQPSHEVRLTRDFEIGKYEVKQAEWKEIMGTNPSRLQGDDLPVTNISWLDAVRFAEQLTKRQNDGYIYRLPTEAEWEYCARASSTAQEVANLPSFALFGQTDGGPRQVGRGTPNLWSIHDMLGNVFEWCDDNYSAQSYQKMSREDPQGPATADPDTGRVIRGGGWRSKADKCRPGYRGYIPPEKSNDETGLRLVRMKK
jgi:formylglycine-generating enzyme required for sulfatase activity/predicted Ser/Thr protein kinase